MVDALSIHVFSYFIRIVKVKYLFLTFIVLCAQVAFCDVVNVGDSIVKDRCARLSWN